MIPERDILNAWGTMPDLAALLPAANVRTGRSSGGTLPYATITREDSHPIGRTNVRYAFVRTTLRIDVWHDNYAEGLAIAKQIREEFDRYWMARSDSDEYLRMRYMQDSVDQGPDGIWRFGVTFLAEFFPH